MHYIIIVPTTTDMLLHDVISLTTYLLNHKCIFHSVDTTLLVKGPRYLFTKTFIWLNHYKNFDILLTVHLNIFILILTNLMD